MKQTYQFSNRSWTREEVWDHLIGQDVARYKAACQGQLLVGLFYAITQKLSREDDHEEAFQALLDMANYHERTTKRMCSSCGTPNLHLNSFSCLHNHTFPCPYWTLREEFA